MKGASVFFSLFLLLINFLVQAQKTNIEAIDEVYIERDSSSFPIYNQIIVDGDVIAFDIPAFGDYLLDNEILLKDVHLMLNNVIVEEFPAFVENLESGLVRFEFSEDHLSDDSRQYLYNLKGGATKEIKLGINIGDTSINYGRRASFFFSDIDLWGWMGWAMIVGFLLFFWLMVARFDSILRDELPMVDYHSTKGAPDRLPIVHYHSAKTAPEELPIVHSHSTKSAPEELAMHYHSTKAAPDELKLRDPNSPKTATGKTGAFSFGKAQMVFWTFIVVASFIYIWAFTTNLHSINTTALILLGISSSTLAAAASIDTQKTKEAESKGGKAMVDLIESRRSRKSFFKDILSDKDGLNINRFQAFVFNIIFGVAFVKSVTLDYIMPTFDETQLLLLGLSSGTYVFLKTTEKK